MTVGYGPQAAITCPSGAVNVSPGPGSNIQNAVNAHATGTAFCLGAGTFNITSAITPKTGDSFTGVYGAILDASGWSTTDTTQGIFRAENQDIDNVTIRNLVIRNSSQRGIQAYKDYSDGWVIDHNEIYGNRIGIMHGNYFQIRGNYVHDNWQYGISSYLSTGSVIEDNEFRRNAAQSASYPGNSGNSKWGSVTDTTVQRNYIHDNNSNGIWFDGNLDTGNVITDNTLANNTGNGIFSEVSGQSVIRGNTVTGSIRGIFISASHDTEVYGNTVSNTDRGIQLFQDGNRISESDLYDNYVHDNTVIVPTVSLETGVVPGAVYMSCVNLTSSQCAAYSTSRGNRFEADNYTIPSLTGKYWYWNQALLTFSQWQSQGQDTTGGVS